MHFHANEPQSYSAGSDTAQQSVPEGALPASIMGLKPMSSEAVLKN